MKTVAVIPHYRHEQTIVATAHDLRALGLPCIVVDDGSGEQSEAALAELAQIEGVTLIRRAENGGKGAAVKDALRAAAAAGYSHALQIDADRQHCFADIPRFIAAAEQSPQTVICGRPIYDEDAPKSRRYGREITNFWIRINTGSNEIADGMCGFRIYPLARTVALINSVYLGDRMDFDTEILVRLHWEGVPMEWLDTSVAYAEDGVSHFYMLKDNLHISAMHARLFFVRLWRRIWRRA
ncbi:glycosyltransferase family 2 protein [Cardiobacteriaceae bacterium TAE3-ERU3]|nr:glycosyltransferase family 2 protein [Cardiobacteriaceae bacterium TAE3-ERU3]